VAPEENLIHFQIKYLSKILYLNNTNTFIKKLITCRNDQAKTENKVTLRGIAPFAERRTQDVAVEPRAAAQNAIFYQARLPWQRIFSSIFWADLINPLIMAPISSQHSTEKAKLECPSIF